MNLCCAYVYSSSFYKYMNMPSPPDVYPFFFLKTRAPYEGRVCKKTHDSHVVITRAAWLLRFLRGTSWGIHVGLKGLVRFRARPEPSRIGFFLSLFLFLSFFFLIYANTYVYATMYVLCMCRLMCVTYCDLSSEK